MTSESESAPSAARCLASIVMAASFAIAWSVPTAAAAAEVVIGASQTLLSLPITVAYEQGFFAAEGVQVRVVDCKTGQQCVQALLDRQVDMAVASALVLTLRSFEGADLAVIATIATAAGNIRVVGRRSAGVTAPDQLAGKRIGVLMGTSSQYYLDTFLYFHGVDPAGVKIVPLTVAAMPTVFATNRIDALATYGRYLGTATGGLGPDAVMFADPRIYTETSNLVVGRRMIAERGPEVASVLRALQRAEIFIAAHPAAATPAPAVRSAPGFGQYTYRLSLDQSLVSTMEGIVRWARSGGHVAHGAKPPDLLKIVDAGPLRGAVPTALMK